MNLLDLLVLVGCMAGIAAYGVWKTRGRQGLSHYLKGDERTGWAVIGLSVMATQASAVTFLSMPGQGYQDGLGFVQNYFGAPLALILIAAVFLPMYRRLNVYTAYEFLGRRFDAKTRLLGAALFLLQRGLQAGITVYAPAIILSTVLHWRTDATILLTGLVVIVYTAAGGSQAVNLTQKYQLGVIFCGMLAAFVVLLRRLPHRGGARRTPWPWPAASASSTGSTSRSTRAGGTRSGRGCSGASSWRFRTSAPTSRRFSATSRGLAPREPDRADVQRRAEDPHAVLHPSAGDDGVRLLPVRDAARCASTRRRGRAGSCATRAIGCGTWSGGTASIHAEKQLAVGGLARRPGGRRPLGRGRGTRSGPGRPGPEPVGAGRGEGRPRIAQPSREVAGHRLRLHHVHPRPPAPRLDRSADRRVLQRHALVESRRAERAGVDDDGRLLSVHRGTAAGRRALCQRVAMVHRDVGIRSRSASRSSRAWRRT